MMTGQSEPNGEELHPSLFKPLMLDRRRVEERVMVCFDGDASRLLDLTRIAVPVDDIKKVYAALELVSRDMGLEIVSIDDRFQHPASNGYRDLQGHVRMAASGYIATLMILHTTMLQAKRLSLPYDAQINAIEGAFLSKTTGPLVVVSDLYNYCRPNARLCFEGFESIEIAVDFARRRVRDSIQQINDKELTIGLLGLKWLMHGEDVIVVQSGNTVGESRLVYHSLDEVDSLLEQRQWVDSELDWWQIKEERQLEVHLLRPIYYGDRLQEILRAHERWAERRRRSMTAEELEIAKAHLKSDGPMSASLGTPSSIRELLTQLDLKIVSGSILDDLPNEPTNEDLQPDEDEEPVRRADLLDGVIFSRFVDQLPILENVSLEGARLDNTYFMNSAFRRVDLSQASLRLADFRGCWVGPTRFSMAILDDALFEKAVGWHANFQSCSLHRANFKYASFNQADFSSANLQGANLKEAILIGVDFTDAILDSADLRGADLRWARLVRTSLKGANLEGARIYGASVWDIATDSNTIQGELVVTPDDQSRITVDDLEIGQLIYLLLTQKKLRQVIDGLTSKIVLILGRFTPQRKQILDEIRSCLRRTNWTPVLFDFDKPDKRTITETVSAIAYLSAVAIVDLTDPRSIPQELTSIVQAIPSLPILPIIEQGYEPYGMYEHFERYPWVRPITPYDNVENLVARLPEIIKNVVAEGKRREGQEVYSDLLANKAAAGDTAPLVG